MLADMGKGGMVEKVVDGASVMECGRGVNSVAEVYIYCCYG